MWNRDGDLPGTPWHHYRQLADGLAARGIATFLFDKGGTGGTGGVESDINGRVIEVRAAMACAKARTEVGNLVLVGHSAGSAVVVRVGGPMILLSPVVPPPAGVLAIQPSSEWIPEWHAVSIPNVTHLLLGPGAAGEATMPASVIDAVANGVKSAPQR